MCDPRILLMALAVLLSSPTSVPIIRTTLPPHFYKNPSHSLALLSDYRGPQDLKNQFDKLAPRAATWLKFRADTYAWHGTAIGQYFAYMQVILTV